MRTRRTVRQHLAILVVAMIPTASCGGSTSSDDSASASPTPSPTSSAPSSIAAAPTTGLDSASTTTAIPSTTETAGETSPGTCTVVLTGDREETWTFPQAITSFSTDYWLSEEDLRETVEFLGEDITGGSYEDLVARGEAIITWLQVACSDPDNLIQGALVAPTNATRASDLPMGPGTYPISGGLFDADGPAGTMIADVTVNEDELYGTVAGSGALEITRWDLERIEGTYTFAARQAFADEPMEIDVAVTFSFGCASWFSGC
jgi:hypothetical protein